MLSLPTGKFLQILHNQLSRNMVGCICLWTSIYINISVLILPRVIICNHCNSLKTHMKCFTVCKESKNSSKQCLGILDLKCSVIFKPCIKKIIFGIYCVERSLHSKRKTIPNFWSPKQHRKRCRISDTQRTQRRIQNFRSTNKTGED